MAIVAGVDEAGLGPLLGPLVVSVAAFRLPDSLLDACLWQQLAPVVSRRPTAGALAIADSKLLYHGLRGPGGLAHLERGVMAAVAAASRPPVSLRDLLELLSSSSLASMDDYPWYRDRDVELPCAVASEELPSLDRDGERGISVCHLRSEPVLEGELNRLIDATGSKAAALLEVTGRLLVGLRSAFTGERLLVHLDRQGGRTHYASFLRDVFSDAMLWVLEETPASSAYRLDGADGEMELRFAVGCEERQLPVALASMASKYVRELHMRLVNRYWLEQVPGLEPTAGYPTDARRFRADIAAAAERLGVEERLLWRQR